MDENALISAEAVVTSKRSDHVSIFAVDLDTQPVNPKQFYADPALVKEAVQRFKQAGFAVASVSKFGVSVVGTKQLFEETFKVRLVARPIGDDDQLLLESPYYVADTENEWLINPQQSNFADLLDGVALSPPSQLLMMDDGGGGEEQPPIKAKDWYLYPEEIPIKLNHPEGMVPKKPIHVAVIDSGFHADHPYFKTRVGRGRVKTNNQVGVKSYQEHYLKIEKWYSEWGPAGSSAKRFDALMARKERLGSQEAEELEDLRIKKRKYDLEDVEQYIDEFKEAFQDGFDIRSGHGTSVVTNLLAVAPNVSVTVIKTEYPTAPRTTQVGGHLLPALVAALKLESEPQIISISEGSEVLGANYAVLARNYNLTRLMVQAANALKIVVLFASGNYHETSNDRVGVQNFWETPVIVGGAHYEQESLVASEVAFGYPKDALKKTYNTINTNPPVPHICGLCGPREGYIYVPTPPSPQAVEGGWKVSAGTSLATPQVAAVCAFILDACPQATPAQVKEILMRTATEVTNRSKKTAQKYFLDEIVHTLPNGEVARPGLVNIKRAVGVARAVNFLSGKGVTGDDLVRRATEIVKTRYPNIWGN